MNHQARVESCLLLREFTQAVEQKQVAQQEAEKARFLVEKAEFHKKAAVIQVGINRYHRYLQKPSTAMYLDDEAVLNVIMIRQRETLKLRSCWLLPLPRFVNPY